MLVIVAGGLGEVGSSVAAALTALGHDVLRASARRQADVWRGDASVIAIEAAVELITGDRVDLLVNASGPGDRRGASATWRDTSRDLSGACLGTRTSAVLLSTTRVMEGYERDYEEAEPPLPMTDYARLNTENEALWGSAGGKAATVLRITNFFCQPQARHSPQSGLLPWSLVTEALETGAIQMRSGANLIKEFVSARDVATAALCIAESDEAPKACVTSPGAALSLSMLARESSLAVESALGSRPAVSFGPDGEQPPRCSPGWLAASGWQSSLTADELRGEVVAWLAEAPR